jgi:tRNA pseudouridine55 synthase
MDGLLIVDKPSGPTSHDVVARVRRAIGEKRIGHTGTLDPLASGVLPLVVGRATRLARLLNGDKEYIAVVQLGVATDTRDVSGRPLGSPYEGQLPGRDSVAAALVPFRGTFLQQPPAFSAKRIDGRRSYDIARQDRRRPPDTERGDALPETRLPAPVSVTTYDIELLDISGPLVTLRVRSSAGFYIRSLAHDLGEALGTGACLAALQRTEAAGARIERAVPLAAIEQGGAATAAAALVPMAQMVPTLPAIALTGDGVVHARCGRILGPADTAEGFPIAFVPQDGSTFVRLLDAHGQLVGLAEPASTPGLLHPSVILM